MPSQPTVCFRTNRTRLLYRGFKTSLHMPSTDLKQVNAMFDRLDGLVSFTIIRFAYTIAKNYLSNEEIVAVCMIMSILIWIVLDMPRCTSSTAKTICLSLQNMVIMVMSQPLSPPSVWMLSQHTRRTSRTMQCCCLWRM